MNKIIISPTVKQTIEKARDIFLESYEQSVKNKGYFSVVLSGGHTPKPLYEELSGIDNIRWEKVYIFWGDERLVPPEHDDSNYHLAYDTLLSKISIPEKNITRIKGELSPNDAAADYHKALEKYFNAHERKFDLILLGMGTNGHTASLFPGTDALLESTRWVVSNFVPELNAWRITLTYPAIISAGKIMVLVTGEKKAKTLKSVLEGKENNNDYPITRILSIKNEVMWVVDHEAGKFLSVRNNK
jgi:6-phosphogluconolactonase